MSMLCGCGRPVRWKHRPVGARRRPSSLERRSDERTEQSLRRRWRRGRSRHYREDYGLTALEAMQWQRPLIVCSDGGGLVDIVNDTGAGIIVDPTPQAIAAGVRRITEEPGLATELIERCRGGAVDLHLGSMPRENSTTPFVCDVGAPLVVGRVDPCREFHPPDSFQRALGDQAM